MVSAITQLEIRTVVERMMLDTSSLMPASYFATQLKETQPRRLHVSAKTLGKWLARWARQDDELFRVTLYQGVATYSLAEPIREARIEQQKNKKVNKMSEELTTSESRTGLKKISVNLSPSSIEYLNARKHNEGLSPSRIFEQWTQAVVDKEGVPALNEEPFKTKTQQAAEERAARKAEREAKKAAEAEAAEGDDSDEDAE